MRVRLISDYVTKAGTLPRALRSIAVVGSIYAACGGFGQAQTVQPWMQQVNKVIGTNGKVNPDGVLTWHLIRMDLAFKLTLGGVPAGSTLTQGTAETPVTTPPSTGTVGGVTFDPASLNVNVGQIATAQISSGVNMTEFPPAVSSNSNSSVASASITGFQLNVTGKSAGSTTVRVCLAGGPTCGNIPVTVTSTTGAVAGLITTGSFSLQPPMADGFVAFRMTDAGQGLMTVEFPVREPEVDTFVSTLQSKGTRITAIHNHYVQEEPRIIFVHAEGVGDPVKLAQAVQAAWSAVGAPVDADGESDSDDTVSGLDPKQLGSIIQGQAEALDGIVDVSVGRAENVTDTFDDRALTLPSEMGPQSEFEFQPLTGGQAVMVGEFCLRASEVNPVIQALRTAGFAVSALHNHFLFDDPHLFFVHVSAAGNAIDLAATIRKALDLTNSKRL